MIALSTFWNPKKIENGKEIISQILDAGFTAIELDCYLTHKTINEMMPLFGGKIQVMSVQNFCPTPDILPKSMAGTDAFLLSSTDKEQRELAVKYTIKTIELADSVESRIVVCHLGYVDVNDPTKELLDLYDKDMKESDKFESLLENSKNLRESKSHSHLDALLFSLDKLNRRAESLNIFIGIENRLEFRQMPNLDEIGIILNEFRGANIGYWHNVEYAQIHEKLGFAKHEDFLKKYSDKMIGIHLPVIKQSSDDEIDGDSKVVFKMVNQYIKENVIKVIQAQSEIPIEELLEAQSFFIV
jgi:sugar phosphate isomerase/epimerase